MKKWLDWDLFFFAICMIRFCGVLFGVVCYGDPSIQLQQDLNENWHVYEQNKKKTIEIDLCEQKEAWSRFSEHE